ncbi:unnamed protein product [Closterium sp. Yama58-4]|nr:unnamed protein product [Closterium sp. Yama58-4]
MKSRQQLGDRRGRIRIESQETRGGEPFGDPDNQACAEPETADIASSDSEPEEFWAYESSDSEADSDATIASDDSDEDPVADDLEIAADSIGASMAKAKKKGKGKAVKPKKKRKLWTEEEMTELAAARWFTREDLKSMQGKQGSQYWKKLRRHLRKANPNWTRKSEAMKQQWKRLEREYKEIGEALAMSGGGNVARPGWFGYMEEIRAGTAALNPHVVDGGGAGEDHADPLVNPVPAAPAPATLPLAHGPQAGPSGLTPTDKAPTTTPVRKWRVSESATLAGAKLIADTLKECNQAGLAKLEAITQLIMSAISASATSTPDNAATNTPDAAVQFDAPLETAGTPSEMAGTPPETAEAPPDSVGVPTPLDPTVQQ